MRLSQFGGYYLPLTKVGTLQFGGSFVDAFQAADEEDGVMPTMGNDPFPMGEVTITATFMVGPSFLSNPIPGISDAYSMDEGGLDAARYDFSRLVLASGIQTLTILPSPGETATVATVYARGGTTAHGAVTDPVAISSWTCSAQAQGSWQTVPHPNGEMAYGEASVTFLIASGLWTVNFASGDSSVVPIA